MQTIAATTSVARLAYAPRTAGSPRNSAGTRFTSRDACHVDVAELATRPKVSARCTSSAMPMIAARIAMLMMSTLL